MVEGATHRGSESYGDLSSLETEAPATPGPMSEECERRVVVGGGWAGAILKNVFCMFSQKRIIGVVCVLGGEGGVVEQTP